MQRRLLAAVAAFLIAAVGAVVLVSYAQSADARAQAGTQEVSLTLQPQQAVDGALKAGDRVGVLVLGADATSAAAAQSIDGVLVTRSTGDTESADPSAQVTVTLALDGPQSAAVIAGMQEGTVWLSLQEMARPGSTTDSSLAATPSAGAQS